MESFASSSSRTSAAAAASLAASHADSRSVWVFVQHVVRVGPRRHHQVGDQGSRQEVLAVAKRKWRSYCQSWWPLCIPRLWPPALYEICPLRSANGWESGAVHPSVVAAGIVGPCARMTRIIREGTITICFAQAQAPTADQGRAALAAVGAAKRRREREGGGGLSNNEALRSPQLPKSKNRRYCPTQPKTALPGPTAK